MYVDTDAIFVRPPEHLFQLFDQFTEDQVAYFNGSIITWILHQIIMFSNKAKLLVG